MAGCSLSACDNLERDATVGFEEYQTGTCSGEGNNLECNKCVRAECAEGSFRSGECNADTKTFVCTVHRALCRYVVSSMFAAVVLSFGVVLSATAALELDLDSPAFSLASRWSGWKSRFTLHHDSAHNSSEVASFTQPVLRLDASRIPLYLLQSSETTSTHGDTAAAYYANKGWLLLEHAYRQAHSLRPALLTPTEVAAAINTYDAAMGAYRAYGKPTHTLHPRINAHRFRNTARVRKCERGQSYPLATLCLHCVWSAFANITRSRSVMP